MTATGHAVVSHLSAGMHPAVRLVWGVMSHWLLDDALKEYRPKGLWLTSPETWPRHWAWLGWQVVGILLFLWITGDWWGLAFGLLPDILDGAWVGVNKLWKRDVWQSGRLRFHVSLLPNLAGRRLSLSANTALEATLLIAAYMHHVGG